MSRTGRFALTVAVAAACLGFVALGVWQLRRLEWKLDLIARVERRVHATPVVPPEPAKWPAVGSADEYLHVRLHGRFEPREVLVQAVTELGGGYWVLAPLRLDDGHVVWVNRGFVPPERREPGQHEAPPAVVVELTGLLRLNEPKGGFLRHNQPAQDRWYSRDVVAMARRLGLAPAAAPFFVDEDADPAQTQRWPRPGLTVIQFTNHHAIYAATWFALAAMSAAAAALLLADGRRAAREVS